MAEVLELSCQDFKTRVINMLRVNSVQEAMGV